MRKLINFFFLWRRNDATSIAFKVSFFAALTWLIASIFTTVRYATATAAAVGAVFLVRYLIQNRREHAALLEHVGGDRAKLAALKRKLRKSGAAGGFMMEMLREGMSDDYDEEDEDPITEEQRAANKAASEAVRDCVLAAIDAHPELAVEDRDERLEELEAMYGEGEHVVEVDEAIMHLLPERVCEFMLEDCINDDDHAGIVEAVADATQGAWAPTDVSSTVEDRDDSDGFVCLVKFTDGTGAQAWRFTQDGDWLSENFLRKLVEHAKAQSRQEIRVVDGDEHFCAVVLPRGFRSSLLESDKLKEVA